MKQDRNSGRPEVLIEHWLPVQELSIESIRERSASSALPPLYFLHVWWARRPLAVSRAAILAALLPSDTDHAWFLRTLGIFGDPVAAYERIQQAGATRLGDPYGYKRAFTYTPDAGTLDDLRRRIAEHWGREHLVLLDPMAGGGSIPFEGLRYGLDVWANDLNPVACVILKATCEYPAYFGEQLAEDIAYWAGEVHKRAKRELERFYPCLPGEQVSAYIWAHTVKCPGCGLVLPLSPNWWLERAERRIASRPVVRGQAVHFEIVEDPAAEGFDPDEGTVARGRGKCLACSETVPLEAIHRQGQAGRIGQILVSLVVRRDGRREYRTAGRQDLEAVAAAEQVLEARVFEYANQGLLPDEDLPLGYTTEQPKRYGILAWRQMFTPRQLLSHVVHLKHIRQVGEEMAREFKAEQDPAGRYRWEAVMTYLALLFDKTVDYNSRMTRWAADRAILKGSFDRHDYAFKWSFGEAVPVYENWPWATNQILDAYRQLAKLAAPYRLFAPMEGVQRNLGSGAGAGNAGGESEAAGPPATQESPPVHVTQGNAATYYALPDGSVDIIVVDPPYYDNVMYSESADFFYVWQKRALGHVFPELFGTTLTDKQQETVANVAQFNGRKGTKELAQQDYEDKMRAAFRRMHGLLRDDGVMVVMFTHKQTEAWDSLASALIEGGWEITASWPVHTESEHSLHQAKKNAAQSTILLVCRKREAGAEGEGGWWQQVQGEITRQVSERVAEYEALGVRGVDLTLATFGPALQVICRHWPVRLASGEVITPEYALDLARKVVQEHRWVQLVGARPVEVDRESQFVIYAWDFYKAEQIRFDEARKLYLGVGVDFEDLKRRRLVEKAGEYVRLLTPEQRVRKGGFDPEAAEFETVIDALHAAIWWQGEGGLAAVRRFFERTKLSEESEFLGGMQAYLRALPAVREEFRALREIADGLLHGRIEIPKETRQIELDLDVVAKQPQDEEE